MNVIAYDPYASAEKVGLCARLCTGSRPLCWNRPLLSVFFAACVHPLMPKQQCHEAIVHAQLAMFPYQLLPSA